MKMKPYVAWIGMIFSLVAVAIIFAVKVSNLFAIIPGAFFIAFLAMYCKSKEEKQEKVAKHRKKIYWPLFFAWALVILLAIATIVVAILWELWFLLALVALCGASIWLVHLLIKKEYINDERWIGVPIIALIIAIILFGVFAIGLVRGNNLSVDNLFVENAYIEKQEVGEENVDKQNVVEQNADKQNVVEQNVDKQNVVEQNVDKQNVVEQNVDKQNVVEQNVGKPNVDKQNVDKQEVDKTDKDTSSKEEPHNHSYTSEVVAPTCTEKGYTIHKCACGDVYKDAEKAALGHKFKSEVVKPTTEAQGYTLYTCTVCGHTEKKDYTDKLQPVVTPKFTIVDQGEGWWTVKFEGMNSANIEVDDKSKCEVQWLSENTFKVVNRYDGSYYFSVTDNASGEVAYLF